MNPESNPNQGSEPTQNPLTNLEEWEEFLQTRYPDPDTNAIPTNGVDASTPHAFRNFETTTRPSVRQFYYLNHRHQTVEFVRSKRTEYLPPRRHQMGIWEAMEYLNTLVDDSDPDTELSQLEHLVQTAEQIRTDGHPRWFILTGLIHDLGKVLCLYGEPQWAVVGDTFPVGCAHSDAVVFRDFFEENPDTQIPEYRTNAGIYEEGCGLDHVLMSWGHDEYLYHVVKDYLPEAALYMIRYHSFYPWHRENAYRHLTNEKDRQMLPWVQAFNPYDLYTKSHNRPNLAELRPYYEDLIAEYFPPKLDW